MSGRAAVINGGKSSDMENRLSVSQSERKIINDQMDI